MAQCLDGDDPLAEMESLLTCSICLGTFNEPRTLPCFHSFCRPCLETFVTNQRDKGKAPDKPDKKIEEFNCPSCRSTFILKIDEEVAGMCSNHFIRNMLDVLSIQRQAKSKAAKCSTFQCEKDATSRCMKCELFLCETCLKFHANWPAFAKHSVLSMSELTKSTAENRVKLTGPRSRCKKHENKVLKFYCQTCKELICRYCMDFDHGKQNHSCLLVKDVADKKREALKTSVHDLECEHNKQSEALQAVTEVTQCLKENVKLAKDEVSRHKQEVLEEFTQKLEQNFQGIINELDQKYNEGYDSLAKQSVEMKLQLDKVQSSLDFSKNLLERGSQEDILSSQAMIQETVETLEKERTQPIKPVHDGNIKYTRKPIQNDISMFANLLGQVKEKWKENTIVEEAIEYIKNFDKSPTEKPVEKDCGYYYYTGKELGTKKCVENVGDSEKKKPVEKDCGYKFYKPRTEKYVEKVCGDSQKIKPVEQFSRKENLDQKDCRYYEKHQKPLDYFSRLDLQDNEQVACKKPSERKKKKKSRSVFESDE